MQNKCEFAQISLDYKREHAHNEFIAQHNERRKQAKQATNRILEMDHEVLNKPYRISSELTVFYSKSVGRSIDLGRELSILLDWEEAIEDCSKMAKTSRNRPTLNDMKKFKKECAMFIECNSQK